MSLARFRQEAVLMFAREYRESNSLSLRRERCGVMGIEETLREEIRKLALLFARSSNVVVEQAARIASLEAARDKYETRPSSLGVDTNVVNSRVESIRVVYGDGDGGVEWRVGESHRAYYDIVNILMGGD